MSDQQQHPTFTAPTPPAFTPPQAPPFTPPAPPAPPEVADDQTEFEVDLDETEAPEPNDHAPGLGVTGKFPEPHATPPGDEDGEQ